VRQTLSWKNKNRKPFSEKTLRPTSSLSNTKKKNKPETLRIPPCKAHLLHRYYLRHSHLPNRTITISSEQEASNKESPNSSRDQRQLSPSHQVLPTRIFLKVQADSTTATDHKTGIALEVVFDVTNLASTDESKESNCIVDRFQRPRNPYLREEEKEDNYQRVNGRDPEIPT
jgi:hypothetical protein